MASKDKIDLIRENYPKLYYIGQGNYIFTRKRFTKWICIGIY